MSIMKITVVGLGYVGMSNAVLLSQRHDVIALDIDTERIAKVNAKCSPIDDKDISHWLKTKNLSLRATTNAIEALMDVDFVVIATPTDYDSDTNCFNTSTVEAVARQALEISNKCTIIVRSTVPVGFIDELRISLNYENIFFSPEFLREGRALYDSLHPSRIVVGGTGKQAQHFANLLLEGTLIENISVHLTGSREAEAIKLFSNAYLAMRVSYFNELDSYAIVRGLNTREIIEGIGQDPRIGDFYNNPSFGYGGYCLPKDTKQLLSNYEDIPQNLIAAVVESNQTRKKFIAENIISMNPKVLGFYRLTAKSNVMNLRENSTQYILHYAISHGISCIVYEPDYKNSSILGASVVRNLQEFKNRSDLIVANRSSKDLEDIKYKIYTRDIYGVN